MMILKEKDNDTCVIEKLSDVLSPRAATVPMQCLLTVQIKSLKIAHKVMESQTIGNIVRRRIYF